MALWCIFAAQICLPKLGGRLIHQGFMIVVENLTKQYGPQTAVDHISFRIEQGEVVGLLGPNGAGKSTTMKMITCYMAPSAGSFEVAGVRVEQDPEAIKRKIGYLPENNPLYLDMAIVDYLRFAAEIQGVPSAQISQRIRRMIDMCGLDREKHKKIGELSKGYRQRVGLAQAMIHDPDILILDEPTTGLDPNQIIEIRNLIKELGRQKTVILSSHILSEVEATCDRIIIINRGKIVADGKAEDLRRRSSGQEVLSVRLEADVTEAATALSALDTVEKVLPASEKNGFLTVISQPGQSSRKAIFDLCVRRQWYLLDMSGSQTSLEDVFRELTN